MKSLLLVVAAIVLIGCSTDWKASVESDTAWSGTFGNRTVAGEGHRIVDLPDNIGQVCCTVYKETEYGYLKVQIFNDGDTFTPDGEMAITTASYGMVNVCTPYEHHHNGYYY